MYYCRAAVFLRIADLISTKYRSLVLATTMIGQVLHELLCVYIEEVIFVCVCMFVIGKDSSSS